MRNKGTNESIKVMFLWANATWACQPVSNIFYHITADFLKDDCVPVQDNGSRVFWRKLCVTEQKKHPTIKSIHFVTPIQFHKCLRTPFELTCNLCSSVRANRCPGWLEWLRSDLKESLPWLETWLGCSYKSFNIFIFKSLWFMVD